MGQRGPGSTAAVATQLDGNLALGYLRQVVADSIVDAFAGAFESALTEQERAGLPEPLARAWERATVHGSFGVPPDAWVRYLARRCTSTDALDSVHAADLLLALACLRRDAEALTTLQQRIGPVIDRTWRKSGLKLDQTDFRQRVMIRILVSDEGPPRLATYRGRGPLEGWVSLVAARYAVDLQRKRAARVSSAAPLDEALLADPSGPDSPEVQALRRRYGTLFRDSFREALRQLEPDERLILRLRYVHGISVSEIARTQGVHRVTMSRALTALRERILQRVIGDIADHEGIPERDVQSALRLVESRIDVSLTMLEY